MFQLELNKRTTMPYCSVTGRVILVDGFEGWLTGPGTTCLETSCPKGKGKRLSLQVVNDETRVELCGKEPIGYRPDCT